LRLFNNFITSTLRYSKRLILVIVLSGSLQFITLLPGVTFVLIVAFLTIAVVLDARLIGYPFRLRLGSFILFLIIRTRLTISYIDLYSLQSIVVVFLSRDILLDLRIRSALVDSFLLYLSFIDTFVDLYRDLIYLTRYC
jgi:hypothetical protein